MLVNNNVYITENAAVFVDYSLKNVQVYLKIIHIL